MWRTTPVCKLKTSSREMIELNQKQLCVLLKITKHACVDKLDKVVKLEVENMVRVVGRQGRSLRER